MWWARFPFQVPATPTGKPPAGTECRPAGVADSTSTQLAEGAAMATGETGFSDVMFDLVSAQYHALKAGHDYGQYVRDARNAGYDGVASFLEQGMPQGSQ